MSNKNPESLSKMKAGDVLVSHPTAVREHEIRVIPDAPHAMSPTHGEAVSDGRSEADVLGVDAWLTEDHTHVVKIASHRASDDHDARTHGLVLKPSAFRPPSTSVKRFSPRAEDWRTSAFTASLSPCT